MRKKQIPIMLSLVLVMACSVSGLVGAAVEEGRVANEIWSGYWWPMSRGEILGPLSKYDSLTGAKSATWERANNPAGRSVPSWYGLCHGWAAASAMETEPRTSIRVGNQSMMVSDLKGLLCVAHSDDVANFFGDRYGDSVGSEDLQDVYPDVLWMALRRHLKEQRIPLILDVEPGSEVWNYPVFAYTVEYNPVSANSKLHNCTLSVWMADNSVSQSFVGLKRAFQRYTFQVEIDNGAIIMGTGKWTGSSQKLHPDFAWSPYVVRSSNPHISYNTLCQLIGRTPATAVPPPVTPPTVTVTPPTVTVTPPVTPPTVTVTPPVTPPTVTVTPPVTPPTVTVTPPVAPPTVAVTIPSVGGSPTSDATLTLTQLLLLLHGKKSDFDFDISAGQFDGKYKENDLLTINGVSGASGYLYLFGMDPAGNLSVLYPQPGDAVKVTANQPFTVPSATASYQLRLTPPYGNYIVHGIVSEKPLHFTGEYDTNSGKLEKLQPDTPKPIQSIVGWNELVLRTCPTEQQYAVMVLQDAKSQSGVLSSVGTRLSGILGRFSQDQVIIYVGPRDK